jgi:hypothetical protein
MSMHQNVHVAIRTQIRAAWPEITGQAHPIFRVTQIEHFPWMERIRTGGLEAPWVVYQMEQARERTGMGGSVRVYASRLSVYYITRYGYAAGADDAGRDVAVFIEGKLEALAARFFSQDAWPAFAHEAGGDVYDVTAENAANRVFIPGRMNYLGGMLSVPIIFGAATSPNYVTPDDCPEEP